jgi:hypothetical protein
MDIIVAKGQTGRIRVLLEDPFNQCSHIGVWLRPESQESFVDGLAHHVGQPDPALAERPRLAKAFGIEPYVNQTGTHERCPL